MDIEPLPEFSEKRRERIERDLEIKAQFAEFGDDLWELRSKMDQLSAKLVEAIQKGSETTEEKAREKLRDYEQRDPELVYMLELADLEEATADGRHQDAAKHKEKAMAARSCLPHFNLDGLWVRFTLRKHPVRVCRPPRPFLTLHVTQIPLQMTGRQIR